MMHLEYVCFFTKLVHYINILHYVRFSCWVVAYKQAACKLYKQFPSSLLLFRFEVINVLSKGDNSWKGLRGRVNASTLKSHLPPLPNSSEKEKILVCICGPNPFTAGISKYVHMCLCVCVGCYHGNIQHPLCIHLYQVLPWQHHISPV